MNEYTVYIPASRRIEVEDVWIPAFAGIILISRYEYMIKCDNSESG
jgi:hypothetical protein